MCFKLKQRIIQSRSYYLRSGYIILGFSTSKKDKQTLYIDLFNKSGDTHFEVIDRVSNNVLLTIDNQSNIFELPLSLNQKIRINIKAKKAVGHYKIYLKRVD